MTTKRPHLYDISQNLGKRPFRYANMIHSCRADMPLISSHALSLEYPVSPGDACVGGGVLLDANLSQFTPG